MVARSCIPVTLELLFSSKDLELFSCKICVDIIMEKRIKKVASSSLGVLETHGVALSLLFEHCQSVVRDCTRHNASPLFLACKFCSMTELRERRFSRVGKNWWYGTGMRNMEKSGECWGWGNSDRWAGGSVGYKFLNYACWGFFTINKYLLRQLLVKQHFFVHSLIHEGSMCCYFLDSTGIIFSWTSE